LNPFNIGDIKIPIPIIQSGMGIGISLSGLVSTVAGREGISVISTVEKVFTGLQNEYREEKEEKN
jgi:NAD(P)H-dependent flavin oxidoreductase YrpB (nitropropane dioxygenase family)